MEKTQNLYRLTCEKVRNSIAKERETKSKLEAKKAAAMEKQRLVKAGAVDIDGAEAGAAEEDGAFHWGREEADETTDGAENKTEFIYVDLGVCRQRCLGSIYQKFKVSHWFIYFIYLNIYL